MENFKRDLLPLRHGVYLFKKMYPNTPKEIQCISKIPYVSTIGSLMYVMLCTQSDIVLTISVTSRYQSNLDEEH